MQGMLGLVSDGNTLTHQVQVLGPAGTDAWLCRFTLPQPGTPAWQKICTIPEMSTWLLFKNDQELQAWLAANTNAKVPAEGGGANVSSQNQQGGVTAGVMLTPDGQAVQVPTKEELEQIKADAQRELDGEGDDGPTH